MAPCELTKGIESPLGEAQNVFHLGGHYISILGRNALFRHPADVWPGTVYLETTTKWVKAFLGLAINLAWPSNLDGWINL